MNICVNLDPGGAPSDVSALGKTKTISIDSPFTGVVIIEALCGANWVPLPGCQFQAPGTKTIDAALQQVRVAGGPSGAPSISISGDDAGGQFVVLPAGGGSVDTDALGSFNTIMVSGLLAGDLLKVQISDDNVNWADLTSFQASGIKSLEFVTCWMRVVYTGSGAPDICVGAINDFSLEDFTDFLFIGPANTPTAPNQFNDWEKLLAAIAGVHGDVRIVLDTFFEDAYIIPAPVVPGTLWDFGNVTFYGQRSNNAPSNVFVTLSDGIEFSKMFNISTGRHLTMLFDTRTGPVYRAITGFADVGILATHGQITLGMAATATVPAFQVDDLAAFPIALGDRGTEFLTGPVEMFELAGLGATAGLLSIHSNSGRNALGADIIRSAGAGEGRFRTRLHGGERGGKWHPDLQSGFSGQYILEEDAICPSGSSPKPLDGSLAIASFPLFGGDHAQYDTTAGAIAQALPSSLMMPGLDITISNLAGAFPINVSVPVGSRLDGNVVVPGLNGTDVVAPGTSRTYTAGALGNGAAPVLRWVLKADPGVKNNLTAAVAPVVGDDVLDGYSVGSVWVNLVLNDAYICVDSTAGAAVWIETTNPALSAVYAPTNVTPDRAFDADTVVIAELADVVGTMIADLQAAGILG